MRGTACGNPLIDGIAHGALAEHAAFAGVFPRMSGIRLGPFAARDRFEHLGKPG